MAVTVRKDFLRMHAQLHLRLVHAAIGTYPVFAKKMSMAVNRMLLIFADSGNDDSYIRDLSTGTEYPMRSGNIYFIPCGHEADQRQTKELEFVSFQFNLDLYYGFDLLSKFPECRVIKSPELIAEAQQLIKRQDIPGPLCRINEIIYHLCGQFLEEKPEILQDDMKYYKQYQELLDFIENQGNALTSVADLAEMSGMRQDVFSRKFTREMGLSPKDFITRTLIRKASFLLGESNVLVKEVADQLHFSSEYYFSRFFKQHTGMSPKEFQKHHGAR